MPDIHIRTFLKNLCSDSAAVVHKFERRLKDNGGGNYYQPSQLAIADLVFRGAAYDEAVSRIANIKRDCERKHNTDILKTFYSWWVDHKGVAVQPPKAYMLGPKGKLRVRLHPDFIIKRGSKREVTLLWNYATPAPQWVAGLGVYAMQKYLGPLGFADCAFVVHDVFAGRRHLAGSVPDKAGSLLSIELARQEEAAASAPSPGKSPSP